jgi:hypothetical protein
MNKLGHITILGLLMVVFLAATTAWAQHMGSGSNTSRNNMGQMMSMQDMMDHMHRTMNRTSGMMNSMGGGGMGQMMDNGTMGMIRSMNGMAGNMNRMMTYMQGMMNDRQLVQNPSSKKSLESMQAYMKSMIQNFDAMLEKMKQLQSSNNGDQK